MPISSSTTTFVDRREKLIPLSTIATLRETVQPRTLNRFQQLNSVKITGVGPSIDGALKKLEAKAAEILPPEYSVDYGGQSRQLRNEGAALWKAGVLALLLIFLVLAAQFNSFRDPFIILLGRAARFGRRDAAYLPLEDHAEHLLPNWSHHPGRFDCQEWYSDRRVCQHTSGTRSFEDRSRPARGRDPASPGSTTSAATVFGHLMLIFVTGPRAAARNSIGWVLVVGMAVGTFFTLFVVPTFYLLIARDHSKGRSPEASSFLVGGDEAVSK